MTLPIVTALMYYSGLQRVTQYTDAEIAANAQAELNATSQAYLASTDWYITRHAETGVAVPADVTTARAAARAAIV
jgi:protoporphyrinogen oxidase